MTTPGQGGQQAAPLNAPPAGTVAPGVQPGVSGQIVLAHYVVVFGTNGGVFIYNGTPGPGNIPAIALTAGATDPYGNSVRPGDSETGLPELIVIGSAPSGGTPSYVQLFPGELAGIALGTGDADEQVSGKIVNEIVGSGTGRRLVTAVSAPAFTTALQTQLNLYSATEDNTGGPEWFVSSAGPGGGFTMQAQVAASPAAGTYTSFDVITDAGIVFSLLPSLLLMVCQLVAQDPASPGSEESWHEMPAFATGFSHGTPAPAYKLNPDQTVSFAGQVSVASGTAGATFVTLPDSAYFPVTQKVFPAAPTNGTPASAGSPHITISTTGTVAFNDVPTGSAYTFNLDHIRYPLDY